MTKKTGDIIVVLDSDKSTKRYKRFVMTEELVKVLGDDVKTSAYLPLDIEANKVYVTICTQKPEGFKKNITAIGS